MVTRLECPACGTEVAGAFAAHRLVNVPEPHASLLELFLRVRGNVKEMERELGLSYPTVRARLDEALVAARPQLEPARGAPGSVSPHDTHDTEDGNRPRREDVLSALERGQITATEAARQLRELRRPTSGQKT